MNAARWSLASLWLSQTARAFADWCVRMFVILGYAAQGDQAGWHLATAVFIAPFLVLAPFNGALSNDLRKRRVLAGAAGFGLAVTVLFALLGGPWLLGLTLVAVGTAVYSPTRYALLPAAATDAGVPLARVNGWVELGGSGAIVLAVAVAVQVAGIVWFDLPAVIVLAAAASLVTLLAALPVRFPSDVRRSEPARAAVAGFFRDTGRIWGDDEARGSLLGLAAFLGLVIGGSGAVLTHSLEGGPGAGLVEQTILVGLGVAGGSFLASLQGHPRRSLGLIPFGGTGLLAALAWAALAQDKRWPCLAMGAAAGLANVPLRAAYQAAVPADARGNAMAVSNSANYLATVLLAGLLVVLVRLGLLPTPAAQLGLLAVLCAVGVAVAWRVLYREALEQFLEFPVSALYRIVGHGPGVGRVPRRGPLLVVANHSAWFDPLWLAKVLPRRLIPMMTSSFYDLPGLRWLMAHVAHAIRVPDARFRREAPELQEAISALDRGETVVIFPEGMLRRREDVLVRPFGQGVWRILRQRPLTPVVVCWIEGGWGSYTSFRGGPPATNKRLDWRRPIQVAVSAPQLLDPALVNDPRATRTYLMQACLAARRYLGLEAPVLESAEFEAEADADEQAGAAST